MTKRYPLEGQLGPELSSLLREHLDIALKLAAALVEQGIHGQFVVFVGKVASVDDLPASIAPEAKELAAATITLRGTAVVIGLVAVEDFERMSNEVQVRIKAAAQPGCVRIYLLCDGHHAVMQLRPLGKRAEA